MSIKPRFDIPDELTALRQFLLWRYIQKPEKPKPDKVPFTAMGYKADVTNPEHWSRYEIVLERSHRPGFCDGIGFVFTAEDPYCGIDLDHIWQSDADEGVEWAAGVLERFSDTYSEVSPSGTGVKIWCKAKTPRCGKWAVESGAIEVYDHARFFTITGKSAGVMAITNHQVDVDALIANLDEDRRQQPHAAIPDAIPQGQRHNTLVSLAGTMWRRGMMAEAIEAALVVTDAKQCSPPHGPDHVRKIVASMSRWPR
jgi:primase-polymerase (primpol)-like protein